MLCCRASSLRAHHSVEIVTAERWTQRLRKLWSGSHSRFAGSTEEKRASHRDRFKHKHMATSEDGGAPNAFDRVGTESLLKRRFFVTPAFEIYGGVAGLYDYGPPGCAVKNNLLQLWRSHFVLQELMLELECTCLTPEPVLKASGHVDRFSDFVVNDVLTGSSYRADHVLGAKLDEVLKDKELSGELRADAESTLARVDELDRDALHAAMKRFDVRAPDSGNELSEPFAFNLMFRTSIGPSGTKTGFLRPETAQGIFVNFRRLMDFAGNKLPFACAQVGLSFRNEIAPRAGLLRVREFMQAEIEHFVHPEHKRHAKFASVRHVELTLFPRKEQNSTRRTVQMTAGDAVAQRIIDNESLAYYVARTYLFAVAIGLRPEHVRFRQHLADEMAHYASDCWDLEVNTSYKWIECAGLADRSCFDLKSHSEASQIELNAREVYDEVRTETQLLAAPKKQVIGKAFRSDGRLIMEALKELSLKDVEQLRERLDAEGSAPVTVADGRSFDVGKDMIAFEQRDVKVTGRNFYPSVIEPSFGVGRLLYCLFEHAYSTRDERVVLALNAAMAPIKCVVLPLSKNDVFADVLGEVVERLGAAGLVYRVDETGASIGKRYSRFDELGTPFGITVDFESVKDRSVTLRERDSMEQVRSDLNTIVDTVVAVVQGRKTWADVIKELPRVERADESDV